MKSIQLYTDGSVNVKSGIGYGACLILTDLETPHDELKNRVQVKCFENTSSTRLELETLLWALSLIPDGDYRIDIHTDSNNIVRLPQRRHRLESSAYRSNKNRLLANHDLYKKFFTVTDKLDYHLIKVEGHQPGRNKDNTARLFTFVDKASRKALRNHFNMDNN